MNRLPKRRFVAALLAGCLAAAPLHVFAQDGETAAEEELLEPTEAQRDYNKRGVILTQDGKHKEAIASFRSSLSQGELNITYLNLGRAYFRLERCLDAREAYDAVLTSPKVKAPTPTEIANLLSRFEGEYSATCAATIAISCEGDPMVSVDDRPARSCSTVSAWPVVPGEHEIVAVYDDGEVKEVVTVAARSAVAVSFEEPEAVAEPVEADPDKSVVVAKATESSTPAYVWITAGVGAALIGSAVAWDLLVTDTKIDELEDTTTSTDAASIERAFELRDDIKTDQTITLVLGAAGGAILLTSAILWLTSGGDETPTSGVSAYVGEDGAGVVVGGTF